MRLKYAFYCLRDDYENDHKACPLLGSLHFNMIGAKEEA